jgi:pyruvate kinase
LRLYESSPVKEQEQRLLERIDEQLKQLRADMLGLETTLLGPGFSVHEAHRQSARNLVHYLALRRHDIRELQLQLGRLGLSSLGRTENHVLSAVQAVHGALTALLGTGELLSELADPPISMDEGSELLRKQTEALLGPAPTGRNVRIMVTMPTEAAKDAELVHNLVQSGMDCMRINCAHDGPEVWMGMIRNLQKAREETGRPCRIEMDVAGPKLRTGPIVPGPAVIKCRPKRDPLGRVVAGSRVWLAAVETVEPTSDAADALVPVPGGFLGKLRPGDTIRLRDARDAQRSLRVTKIEGNGCWAESKKTIYFAPGVELRATARPPKRHSQARRAARGKVQEWRSRIGAIPPLAQTLLVRTGDTLVVTRSAEPGKPEVRDRAGRVVSPAQIGVTLPEFFNHAKAGEPIWFDDGKIGGVIRSVEAETLHVEITQARPQGGKLGAGKGINLPETHLEVPALTAEDLESLKFIVKHADIVGYSFVRTEADVRQLLARLSELGGEALGVVLKIETRKAFENLPKLILAAMRTRAVGVMIARGDLAVECGYQRLAEVQEEILWLCEAAHAPVIWATQVLESLAKSGLPSRSEITDAAMGERAECVMLNKGPYVVTAVSVLDDILKRMQDHQEKKRSMLRQLHLASSFATTS